MAKIVLHRLSKLYPDSGRALHDVSLEVEDGELLVVAGPSGAGKSTLLRLVAGLEPPSAGRLVIGEEEATALSPRRRDVAMVFQQPVLYPHLSIRENLAFGLRRRRSPRPEIERRVALAAEWLGLLPLLDRRPQALSGGEQVRVNLGRAIVRHPRAFLLDEPLSHLDGPLRVQLRSDLKRLHESQRVTTLLVTHDQEEAMALGHRIAILHRGSLLQVGSPSELYDHPVDGFVAGFLGRPSMNFLRGRVRLAAGGAELWFETGGVWVSLPSHHIPLFEGRDEEEFLLGIRSEGITITGVHGDRSMETEFGGDRRGGEFEAVVSRTEMLGREVDLHLCTRDDQPIVLRSARRQARPAGSRLMLRIDPDQTHVFEVDGDRPCVTTRNG